ncbi:MAG: 2-oxoacid:acceptor oxidoreductase family protein [Alphaproteobacteria bacterium]|uniref:2-oxoacid:acceptor oxidoreductase family protein n=1 Tax=Candidatus Nitrobium versatile TaxID=2884831 RepID=A0A953J782_9BACT|nr:2-oxoacid:acceptor oxidoreductase family protein [Candidatus Nitrobium versatile]
MKHTPGKEEGGKYGEKRIIIAGSGGQGILFLGRLITYAAMLDAREVTWFPSYGAEMRGGTANCTVIISQEMIGSPVIRNPGILMVMNEASYRRFSGKLLPGGLLLYDSSLISPVDCREDISVRKVSASEIAASLKSTKGANMVMMGAFVAATGCLTLDSALKAVGEITPVHRKESLRANRELIMKGYHFVEST